MSYIILNSKRIKMSLVDKLDGVHMGDILLLNGNGYSAVGYVTDCSIDKVALSTELPYDLQDKGKKQRIAMVGSGPTKVLTKDRKYGLKHFDSYEVLTPKKE